MHLADYLHSFLYLTMDPFVKRITLNYFINIKFYKKLYWLVKAEYTYSECSFWNQK